MRLLSGCVLLGSLSSFFLEVYRKNLPRKFCFPGKEAFSILPYLVFTQQILFDIISQEYNFGFSSGSSQVYLVQSISVRHLTSPSRMGARQMYSGSLIPQYIKM